MIEVTRKEAFALAKIAGVKVPRKETINGGWEALLRTGAKLKVYVSRRKIVYGVCGYAWNESDASAALADIR